MSESVDASVFELSPVARVHSPLLTREQAPRQGDEGGPEAWVVFAPEFQPALTGLRAGDDVLLLTYLDRADRSALQVRPRGNPANPLTGVFATRSPDRPNPIGLHRVRVLEIDGNRVRVADLEALDGTPVLDVKPVLGPVGER